MADYGGNSKVSSSKRLMTADDDNRSSVSVHQVVFNDDLLIEILLRLPLISLFFFKFVSKRWLYLITSPSFFNLRVTRFPNIHPPSGLFLQKVKEVSTAHFDIKHDFLSFDSRILPAKKSAFTFGSFGPDASKVEFLQSCNGLVLFAMRAKPSDRIFVDNRPMKVFTLPSDQIYVYNPSTNMFKMLPKVPGLKISRALDHMRLAFDPAKSPHYKVVHIRPTAHRSSTQTRIYSSETHLWRMGDTYPREWFRGNFARGVYWNNALHWIHVWNRVRHFKLDVEHPHDITTQLPVEKKSYKELFASRGGLLFACAADPRPKHLEFYEMGNGYSGWSVRYVVGYEDSSIAAFLKTQKMSSTLGFGFKVLFIVVGEREEESFVVMELCGKVVKYDLLFKTLDVLCDIDARLTKFRTFPFIASFAGV